jgi:serine/threonine protein kinase
MLKLESYKHASSITTLHISEQNKSQSYETNTDKQDTEKKTAESASTAFSRQEEDREKIEKALGGTARSHIQAFFKKYGQSFQSIVDATSKEVEVLRQTGKRIGFGGLKISKIKKWKFITQLDSNGKISEIFIGLFKTAGNFTKVYTLEEHVILVPKKSKQARQQLLDAYETIATLRSQYATNQELSKEIHEFCNILSYTRDDLSQILPPQPKKFMVEERPVMVAPQATSAETHFFHEPKDVIEIINRLKILRDVAVSVYLFHRLGGIHSDLKVENILVSQNNKGLMHDLGDSRIFTQQDNYETARKKYCELGLTGVYTHYRDYLLGMRLTNVTTQDNKKDTPSNVDEILELGHAKDVFALGLSTVEALKGMYDSSNEYRVPLPRYSYTHVLEIDQHFPINSTPNSISYTTSTIRKLPEIDQFLNTLLKGALQNNYKERISVENFAIGLDKIIHLLTQLANVKNGPAY